MLEAQMQSQQANYGRVIGAAALPERPGDVHGATNTLAEGVAMLEGTLERLTQRLRPVTLEMHNETKAGGTAPEPVRSDVATIIYAQAARIQLLIAALEKQMRDLQV